MMVEWIMIVNVIVITILVSISSVRRLIRKEHTHKLFRTLDRVAVVSLILGIFGLLLFSFL